MAFALVTCPKCKKMLDFSNAGKMREKYGPSIGEEKFVTCFHCGTRIQTQGEWDRTSTSQKVTYLARPIGFLVMGVFMSYASLTMPNRDGGMFPIILFLVMGVLPIVFGLMDLAKIKQSKERTARGD